MKLTLEGLDWSVVHHWQRFIVRQGDSKWLLNEPTDWHQLPGVVQEPEDTDEHWTRCAQECVLEYLKRVSA